jgi:hypothetical protein
MPAVSDRRGHVGAQIREPNTGKRHVSATGQPNPRT